MLQFPIFRASLPPSLSPSNFTLANWNPFSSRSSSCSLSVSLFCLTPFDHTQPQVLAIPKHMPSQASQIYYIYIYIYIYYIYVYYIYIYILYICNIIYICNVIYMYAIYMQILWVLATHDVNIPKLKWMSCIWFHIVFLILYAYCDQLASARFEHWLS